MSTVSAPTALWAIVALALNTACQPSGSILYSAPGHSRALRTSPLVCLADMIVIILSFLNMVFQGNSFRDSARTNLYSGLHRDDAGANEEARIEQPTPNAQAP